MHLHAIQAQSTKSGWTFYKDKIPGPLETIWASSPNDIPQFIKSKLLAMQPPPKTKVMQHLIGLLRDQRQHILGLGVLL